jgi:hypothetical protein
LGNSIKCVLTFNPSMSSCSATMRLISCTHDLWIVLQTGNAFDPCLPMLHRDRRFPQLISAVLYFRIDHVRDGMAIPPVATVICTLVLPLLLLATGIRVSSCLFYIIASNVLYYPPISS